MLGITRHHGQHQRKEDHRLEHELDHERERPQIHDELDDRSRSDRREEGSPEPATAVQRVRRACEQPDAREQRPEHSGLEQPQVPEAEPAASSDYDPRSR